VLKVRKRKLAQQTALSGGSDLTVSGSSSELLGATLKDTASKITGALNSDFSSIADTSISNSHKQLDPVV
jgi:hypothetical protein